MKSSLNLDTRTRLASGDCHHVTRSKGDAIGNPIFGTIFLASHVLRSTSSGTHIVEPEWDQREEFLWVRERGHLGAPDLCPPARSKPRTKPRPKPREVNRVLGLGLDVDIAQI